MRTLTLFLLISTNLFAYSYDLAIATVFQDEARFLKEWIEYHRMLGVDHFYLYNNISEDDYMEVLLPYIEEGVVELYDYPFEYDKIHGFLNYQVEMYNKVLEKTRGDVKWVAFIDTDEFLHPGVMDDIPALLKLYEDDPTVGGIMLVWICFGTSDVERIPDNQTMIETLKLNGGVPEKGNLKKIHRRHYFKSIVRPDRVKRAFDPHIFIYHDKVRDMFVRWDTAFINHYWARDKDFFYNHKVPRWKKWGVDIARCEKRERAMNEETEFSDSMDRFVVELRERMGFTKASK